jgi:Uma2 family endonuclease
MTADTISRTPSPSGKRRSGLEYYVNGIAHIPAWVVDHTSYRRWARSEEFPETGRYSFLNGAIWIDLTMEQIFSHNAVKTEVARVLASLVRQDDLGYFFSDGTLVSHAGAALSTDPDACFVGYQTVETGKARWIEGAVEGYVEVEGTPDMALEVVSTSSLTKDTETLRELYWKAGVAEYWLIDARKPNLLFSLLRHSSKGYTEARRHADGWLRSSVFARQFRLTQSKDRLGSPKFALEVQ